MPIVNYRLNKISGERKDKPIKSLEIKANSTIVSLKKESDKRVGDYLLVNFKYDVEYKPDVGKLSMEGSLWYRHPKLDDMVKDEGGKIELKNEAVKEISTAIIQESLLESIELSRKIQLPPPMQLPKVDVKPEQVKFMKAS